MGWQEIDKNNMEKFLLSTTIIDWRQPDVFKNALELAVGVNNEIAIAKRCYEWVRDNIMHSYDYRINPVTCSASEVLREGTGYCYAKSHLLVALLRANGIPAGLCYQRLSRDNYRKPFVLHGLAAAFIPEIGWYRIDPRGNKPGVDAQFAPPTERLAYRARLSGECDLPDIHSEPLGIVIKALRSFTTWDSLYENLPDIE